MSGRTIPQLSKAMLRRFAKLGQKKYRDIDGLFLAEGLRTVRELLDHLPSPEMLEALIVEPDALHQLKRPERYAGKLFLVGREEGARLAQTATPQGIFGVFRQPERNAAAFSRSRQSLIVALDDVQDPGNVGTILRTAAWFGADAVICGEGTADFCNAKAVRSSAGSIYAVNHSAVRSLQKELQQLKKQGYLVCAASLDGADYRSFDAWPDQRALVIGNEANGISREVLDVADRLVRIPHAGQKPGVESLNASVSAAILMAGLAFV